MQKPNDNKTLEESKNLLEKGEFGSIDFRPTIFAELQDLIEFCKNLPREHSEYYMDVILRATFWYTQSVLGLTPVKGRQGLQMAFGELSNIKGQPYVIIGADEFLIPESNPYEFILNWRKSILETYLKRRAEYLLGNLPEITPQLKDFWEDLLQE